MSPRVGPLVDNDVCCPMLPPRPMWPRDPTQTTRRLDLLPRPPCIILNQRLRGCAPRRRDRTLSLFSIIIEVRVRRRSQGSRGQCEGSQGDRAWLLSGSCGIAQGSCRRSQGSWGQCEGSQGDRAWSLSGSRGVAQGSCISARTCTHVGMYVCMHLRAESAPRCARS